MEPERQLTAESAAAFHEGIGIVMARWSSLELAVQKGWGGPDSHLIAEQLHSDVFTWFLNTPLQELYIDDLEVMLEQGVDRFSTTLEDGSIGEADKLMIMHQECLVSNFSSIEKLREENGRRVPPLHVRQVLNDEDDDSDEDDDGDRSMGRDDSSNMMVDRQGSTRPAVQAEDGWEKIGSRKNRDRRN